MVTIIMGDRMNDRNVGGYISLTTHELNISESKYSGRSAKFSGFENNNAYERGESQRSGWGNRGRTMSTRQETERFRRDSSSGRRGGWSDGDEGGYSKNRTEFKPKGNASSEKRAFRLRKI